MAGESSPRNSADEEHYATPTQGEAGDAQRAVLDRHRSRLHIFNDKKKELGLAGLTTVVMKHAWKGRWVSEPVLVRINCSGADNTPDYTYAEVPSIKEMHHNQAVNLPLTVLGEAGATHVRTFTELSAATSSSSNILDVTDVLKFSKTDISPNWISIRLAALQSLDAVPTRKRKTGKQEGPSLQAPKLKKHRVAPVPSFSLPRKATAFQMFEVQLPSFLFHHHFARIGPGMLGEAAAVFQDVKFWKDSPLPRQWEAAVADRVGSDGKADEEEGKLDANVRGIANLLYLLDNWGPLTKAFRDDYTLILGASAASSVHTINVDPSSTASTLANQVSAAFDSGHYWVRITYSSGVGSSKMDADSLTAATTPPPSMFWSLLGLAHANVTFEDATNGAASQARAILMQSLWKLSLMIDMAISNLVHQHRWTEDQHPATDPSRWALFVTVLLWHLPKKMGTSWAIPYAQSFHVLEELPELNKLQRERAQMVYLHGFKMAQNLPTGGICCAQVVPQPQRPAVQHMCFETGPNNKILLDLSKAQRLACANRGSQVSELDLFLNDSSVGEAVKCQKIQKLELSHGLTCPVGIISSALTHTNWHMEDCGIGAINRNYGPPKVWLYCATALHARNFSDLVHQKHTNTNRGPAAKSYTDLMAKQLPPRAFSLKEVLQPRRSPKAAAQDQKMRTSLSDGEERAPCMSVLVQHPGDIIVAASTTDAMHITCSGGTGVAVASNCHFSNNVTLEQVLDTFLAFRENNPDRVDPTAHLDQLEHLQKLTKFAL